MAALDGLCRCYWKPVFAVIRGRVRSLDAAEEQTQAFFVHLLEKSTLRRVDRARGKFRTFLLTVLWRFLRDEGKRDSAEKRGGGLIEHTLDELPMSWADDSSLVEMLDREWALMVMERALENVGREVAAVRGEEAWNVLRGFLPGSMGVPEIGAAAMVIGITEAGARTGDPSPASALPRDAAAGVDEHRSPSCGTGAGAGLPRPGAAQRPCGDWLTQRHHGTQYP